MSGASDEDRVKLDVRYRAEPQLLTGRQEPIDTAAREAHCKRIEEVARVASPVLVAPRGPRRARPRHPVVPDPSPDGHPGAARLRQRGDHD